MGNLPARWNAFIVVMTLATLVGCQGFSSGKSNATQGTQTLPGALTAAPASVSFGNVQVGTSQVQSDTLSNTGSSSLTVTAATMSGAGFTTTGLNLPLTLDVGQSVSFSIVFGPQTAGSASVSLALTNSASSTPLNVALTGTGVAAGGLTGSPASFSFGNVQVGLGQSKTETLNNTSSQSFTLSQATFSGTGFSTSGLSLPMTLGPSQSASFAVAFTPATVGAANSTLSIAVSGSSTTLDFALSGIGVAPATLSATPASLTFTNVQVGQTQSQTETVRNAGGTNSTISQATIAGSGFSISGLATPLLLTPGQSASFSVTFTPLSAGSVSGSVMIDSDATNPALSVALSGTTVTQSQGTLSATAVNAGSVVVGTSGTQTGTLSATGAERIGNLSELEWRQLFGIFHQRNYVPRHCDDNSAGYVYRDLHARRVGGRIGYGVVCQYRSQHTEHREPHRYRHGGANPFCQLVLEGQYDFGPEQLQRLSRGLHGKCLRFLFDRWFHCEFGHNVHRQSGNRWHNVLLRDHGRGRRRREWLLQHC